MSKLVLPSALRELRFHFSKTGEASQPLLKFLDKQYAILRHSETKQRIPILLREAYGVPPSFTARFEKGREVKTNVEGLDEKEIANVFQGVLKQGAEKTNP